MLQGENTPSYIPVTIPWCLQAQQRVCPPIFQAIKPAEQQDAATFDRGQSIPVQPKGADPEWLPAANLTRASSEGGEANQGRCKCGEIPCLFAPIASAGPACLASLHRWLPHCCVLLHMCINC